MDNSTRNPATDSAIAGAIVLAAALYLYRSSRDDTFSVVDTNSGELHRHDGEQPETDSVGNGAPVRWHIVEEFQDLIQRAESAIGNFLHIS